MESHLKDTQGSGILPRWFPPRIIEQVDGGDNNGDAPATSTARKPQPSVNSVELRTFRDVQVRPSMVLDPSRP